MGAKKASLDEKGQILHDTILAERFSNDKVSMYNKFSEIFENFEIYGNTKDKALLNYCIYKYDVVRHTFKISINMVEV